MDKPYWVRAAVRKKSGSRACGCRLLFAIRNPAPPLTTCGEKNLRAKKKRSGTQQDTLIAETPRTLLHDQDTFPISRYVD
jgi:hypothetical protein